MILFAERFAKEGYPIRARLPPPQVDSFCKKVCFCCRGADHNDLTRLKLILFAERFARATAEMYHRKFIRLKLILFAERFAFILWPLCIQYLPASSWFFLQKGLQKMDNRYSGMFRPPQVDSFCRKVCRSRRSSVPSRYPASSWFFLQKGLLDRGKTVEQVGHRLKLILFAERFA